MRTLLVAIGLSLSMAGCMEASPSASPKTGCYIGGCSDQLCSDRSDVASTCEWTERYACYRDATCERQTDGACGWTETPALTECLASH